MLESQKSHLQHTKTEHTFESKVSIVSTISYIVDKYEKIYKMKWEEQI